MQDVFDKVAEVRKQIEEAAIGSSVELEAFRVRFLGSKNILKDLFSAIKEVPNERKKEFGQLINEVKKTVMAH